AVVATGRPVRFRWPRARRATRFPYTTLFRSAWEAGVTSDAALPARDEFVTQVTSGPAELVVGIRTPARQRILPAARRVGEPDSLDRKSTRLNSSHVKISYAVFCLKKKNIR